MRRSISKTLIVMIFVGLTVGVANAKKPATPSSLDGVSIVDADWVKANAGKIQLYDVRKKAEYVDGHIPGAINVWYHEKSKKTADFDASKDRFDLAKFPSDRNVPVIVHCNGPRCWKSYKAAVTLIEAGYKNVYWFRGGWPEWKSKSYPTE